jgi:hypothetical protein
MKMPIKLMTAALLLLATISCNGNEKAPVSAETLTHILTDMHTAEAAAEGEFPAGKDSILRVYYPQILKKYGVTKVDFDSTMSVYSRQPVAFDSVYSAVMREISKLDTTTNH